MNPFVLDDRIFDTPVYTDASIPKFNQHHEPAGSPEGGQFASGREGWDAAHGINAETGDETAGIDGVAPPIGSSFVVFRLAREPQLDNRNGGNAEGVATYIQQAEDSEKPSNWAGPVTGSFIHAYRVKATKEFTSYISMGATSHDRAAGAPTGREATTYQAPHKGRGEVQYSFPKGGAWEATHLGQIDYHEGKFPSGTIEAADAIRKAFAPILAKKDLAKYSDAQPRDPAGTATGGRWTDGGATQARLDSIAHIESLIPAALKIAESGEVGASEWSDLSEEVQDATRERWVEHAIDNGVFEEEGSSAKDEYVNNNQPEDDEINDLAKEKFIEELASHGINVDPDTVVFNEESDAPNFDEIRTVDGDPIPAKPDTDPRFDVDPAFSPKPVIDYAQRWDVLRSRVLSALVDAVDESDAASEAYSDAEREAADRAWDNMGDTERFGEVRDKDRVRSSPTEMRVPSAWQWDDTADNEDETRSRALARALVTVRTEELLKERGLETSFASEIPSSVWGAWKDSSTSPIALGLQMAAEEELHTLSRLNMQDRQHGEDAITNEFGGKGMDMTRAYVRAQWETTQFLLAKSKAPAEIGLYRAVLIDKDAVEVAEHREVPGNLRTYNQLPRIDLRRNALQSATRDIATANDWMGVGSRTGTRVVLRFAAPHVAVFSVPIFGDNVQEEREVVVLGIGKDKIHWDAWERKAPTVGDVPLRHAKSASAPLVIDLLEQDRGPHWLSGHRVVKFNQHHEPAGSSNGGQFASGSMPWSGVGESWSSVSSEFDADKARAEADQLAPIGDGVTRAEKWVKNPLSTVVTDAEKNAAVRWADEHQPIGKAKWRATTVPASALASLQLYVDQDRVKRFAGEMPARLRHGAASTVWPFGGRYWVVDGNHRAATLKLGGVEHVPVMLRVLDYETGKSVAPLWLHELPQDFDPSDPLIAPVAEKFSPTQPRDPAGTNTGGQWATGGAMPARVARALKSYKPSTKEKQRWGEANEQFIAKMVRGKGTDDNSPADVTVVVDGHLYGIEVKTLLDNSNDKITMHPSSRRRKEQWGATHRATMHTVMLDDRDQFGTEGFSGHRLYYRRGVGAFRLGAMVPVKSGAHLRKLMAEKAKTLKFNEHHAPAGSPDGGQFTTADFPVSRASVMNTSFDSLPYDVREAAKEHWISRQEENGTMYSEAYAAANADAERVGMPEIEPDDEQLASFQRDLLSQAWESLDNADRILAVPKDDLPQAGDDAFRLASDRLHIDSEALATDMSRVVQKFASDGSVQVLFNARENVFSVIVHGDVTESEHRSSAIMQRDFSVKNGELVVRHAEFVLPKETQQHGIATQALADSLAVYEQYGVKQINLTANINVGGYAWAKLGFEAANPGRFLHGLTEARDQEKWQHFPSDPTPSLSDRRFDEIIAVATKAGARAPSVIANMSEGKLLLMGSNWSATMRLDGQPGKDFATRIADKAKSKLGAK